ncbi:MAG: LysR family transcriptional regulator [Dehalococcoidia bacterium]|nr:MAG: LysR family transcriptional regulator [Dehalococcoidia bacterium]
MDFGQLEAFVQVAAHHSFSRAAEALQLTQPSITARIQALERELGEKMFERGGRGVRLTDAGTILLPYAERMLQMLREAKESVEEVRSVQAGSLRLGSALTISTYVLPRILRTFHSRYSGVEVVVHTGRSEQVLSMLLSDEVQVGLVHSLTHPDVETIDLYADEVILVANPDHPFAVNRQATIEEVGSQPVILADRGSSYYALTHGFFRQAGVLPNVAMELDSMEATKRMVEEGLGIALLPRVCLERELKQGLLAEVAITNAPAISRQIALIHRKSRKQVRTVQAFLEVLRSIYDLELPAGSTGG